MDSAGTFNLLLLVAAISTYAVNCNENRGPNIVVVNNPSAPTEAPTQHISCRRERQNVTFSYDSCTGNAQTKIWGCYGIQDTFEYIEFSNSVLKRVKVNRKCVAVKAVRSIRKMEYTECTGSESKKSIRHRYMKVKKCAVQEERVIIPVIPTIPPPTDC